MRYLLALALLATLLTISLLPQRASAQESGSYTVYATVNGQLESVPITFTNYMNIQGNSCSRQIVGSHADPVGNGRDSDYHYPFDTGSVFFDGYEHGTPAPFTGVREDIPGVRITFLSSHGACREDFFVPDDPNAYFTPPPNQAPTARFDYEAGNTLFSIAFDGSESEDPDGHVMSYDWDFGDGNYGSGASPQHTYEERGTYFVGLRVTDDDDERSEEYGREVQVRGPDLRYVVSLRPYSETGGKSAQDDRAVLQPGDTARVQIAVTNTGDWNLKNVRLPGGAGNIEITSDPDDALAFIRPGRQEIASLGVGQRDTLTYLYKAVHTVETAGLKVTAVTADAENQDSGTDIPYGEEAEAACEVSGKSLQDGDNRPCTQFGIAPAPLIVNSVENTPLDSGLDPADGACATGEQIMRAGEEEPECTLRAAMQIAASAGANGTNIEFDIPGGSGAHTIKLEGEGLPPVSSRITIKGPSADGTPVEIDGSELQGGIGFELGSETGPAKVEALAFYGFPSTVLALRGRESVLTGSYIGSDWAESYTSTDPTVTDPLRNGGPAVLVSGDDTHIGGPGNEGNLLIGSTIGVFVDGAWDVEILGNRIGILESPHETHGVDLHGARDVVVGSFLAGNQINYNLEYGIRLDEATKGAKIQNNMIIRSRKDGILIMQGQPGGDPVMIGGEEEGDGNTIERSVGAGIRITGPSDATPREAARLLIQGNMLKKNAEVGIKMEGGNAVQIGGPTGTPGDGPGNTIEDGIRLDPGYASWVQGNSLAHLDPETGSSDASEVVYVAGVRNTIGGETPAEGNVIYGVPTLTDDNDNDGELDEEPAGFGIWDTGTTTTIQFNQVGTEGALFTGVVLAGTDTQVIENTLSGNQHTGLSVRAPATIEGNYIGVTPTGNGALPNGGPGIEVFVQATIGGEKEGDGCERPCNVISGNGGPGILVRQEATGTRIQGNMIGVGADGLTLVGNTESGIQVLADNVRIGGENDIELFDCLGPCNIIAGNGEDGIRNFEAEEYPNLTSEGGSVTRGAGTGGASGLIIEGNFIGTGLPGGGNAGHGIALGALGNDSRVGGTGNQGNLITGNGGAGVLVLASTESTVLNGRVWRGGTGNRIRGNRIMDNGGIAIDLYPNYVLYNLDRMADEQGYGWNDLDMGDQDVGPNDLINWPYLVESGEPEDGVGQHSLLALWTGSEAGSYTLDIYTSETCRGATADAGNYLVSRNISFPVVGGNIDAARVDVPFVPSMPYYVATFTDSEGNTSELSNCRRAGHRPEQAIESVEPGIRKLINRLLIWLDEEAGGKSAQAQTLLVLRSAETPGGDRFQATAAVAPSGTLVMPRSTTGDYWELIALESSTPLRYDVCLNVSDLDETDDLVILGRGTETNGLWRPYDTRLEQRDLKDYACADGLTAMQLTLGSGNEAVLALPTLTTPEDGTDGIDLTTSLVWQALDGATRYDVQISLDGAFGALLDEAQGLSGTSYAPQTLARSQQHYWRVRGITAGGDAGPWSRPFRFSTAATSVGVEDEQVVPGQFVLEANYPNPFNPQTRIGYSLPQATDVHLAVYDVLGREVQVLVNGMTPAGRHEAIFEATGLPTGVYVYRLQAGTFTQTRRMLLLK